MSYQSSNISGSPYSQKKYQHPFDQNLTLRKEQEYIRGHNEQNGQITNSIYNEKLEYSNVLQQLQDKEQEVKRWKERALKVEFGFKEVQILLSETGDMRQILEDKMIEVDQLQLINDNLHNENQILKQNHNDYQIYQQDLEQQVQQLNKKQYIPVQNDFGEHVAKIESQQKEIYNSTQQLETANKSNREKDLTIKRFELQQVEKDNLIRQLRRDIEINQKKQVQKEDDQRREFKRDLDDFEEKLRRENEEFNNERSMYKERIIELEKTFRDTSKLSEDLQQKVNNQEKTNQALSKENAQLNQNKELLNHNLQDTQQKSSHNNITQRTKYEQELENQRHVYENHINKLNVDVTQFEKMVHKQQDSIGQKNLHVERLLEGINNLKKEFDILQGEFELSQEKNIELQKQRNLELELQDGHFKENIDQVVTKYSNQIKYLEQQLNLIRQGYDQKAKENEELRIQLSEAVMKLSDMINSQKHLMMENEAIRQTLYQVQKQKDWEDTEKDDQKKKDLNQLKRYHETLLDQINRENKGIRQVLEQKSKECEEWRSECLRLKLYLQ